MAQVQRATYSSLVRGEQATHCHDGGEQREWRADMVEDRPCHRGVTTRRFNARVRVVRILKARPEDAGPRPPQG